MIFLLLGADDNVSYDGSDVCMTRDGFGSVTYPTYHRKDNRIGYLGSVLSTRVHTREYQYELHKQYTFLLSC